MYNFLAKHGQLVAFGLGAVIILIFFGTVFSGLDAFNALPEDRQGETTIFNFGLAASIVLGIVCIVAAVLFGLYFMVTHPKGAMIGIIALAVIAVLFLVFYSTAGADTGSLAAKIDQFDISATTSKIISGALGTALVLTGVAFASFIVTEGINIFK